LGGKVPFDWRAGDDGELIEVREQQRSPKHKRKQRDDGTPLYIITERRHSRYLTH
jgi:hypothetical protein